MPSPSIESVAVDAWPSLPLDGWRDTYATLHLWTQVVGKLALALSPLTNHSWNTALQITPRGLATLPLTVDQRIVTVTFDFLSHHLAVECSDGRHTTVSLEPRPVPSSIASSWRRWRNWMSARGSGPCPSKSQTPFASKRTPSIAHTIPPPPGPAGRYSSRSDGSSTRSGAASSARRAPSTSGGGASISPTRGSRAVGPPSTRVVSPTWPTPSHGRLTRTSASASGGGRAEEARRFWSPRFMPMRIPSRPAAPAP